MLDLRLMEYQRNIGIIGMYYSGKTVFLTSLINHLQHHGASRFALRKPAAVIRKFKPIPPDPGWTTFDYRAARDSMLYDRKWPKKTADRCQYVCTFERTDWKLGRTKLRLYDLPGERIADASMAEMDFGAWSDHVIYLIRTDRAYCQHAAEFLDAIAAGRPEAEIVRAYKLALARLIHAFKPYISPSTFLLDKKGQMAENLPPEQLAQTRASGLDFDSEFAPLPEELRASRPDLARTFSDRFDSYRREVVLPLVSELRACDSLIVLVDITTLLAGGTGMYNDNRQLLSDLLNVLDPSDVSAKDAIAGYLGDMIRRGKSHLGRPSAAPSEGGEATLEEKGVKKVRRIAFVAPKLDLVHPTDRDKMVSLLKDLAEPIVRDRDKIRSDYFSASSVVSTVVVDPERRLLGMSDGQGPDGTPIARQYEVSALPESWPDNWASGAYSFPEASPRWPERQDLPPRQVHLNDVFEFVIT